MVLSYPIDNLIEQIVCEDNMNRSFDYVVGHLDYEAQRKKYRPLRESYVKRLTKEIADGTFRVMRSDVRDLHVKDGPKERDVQAPTVYKRVGVHAIMVIVERVTYPSLIKNTAASIKGRGMHWLHHIVEEDLKNVPQLMKYYHKSDIEHYYDNIDQSLMKAELRKYISDEVLLPMLDNFVELMPNGLSKGLRSSQCFANLFLSPIDHFMCERSNSYTIHSDVGDEVRYLYYRYCDDVVLWSNDKKALWKLRDMYVGELAKLGLSIKHDEAVRPISEGLDFLGFIQYEDYSLIRKRIKKNAARKLHRIKSRKRRQEVIGSFKGMACHADCKHLFYKLTGLRMKKFSEMGVTYTPEDGKKRFPGNTVRLSSITNVPIVVLDYEKDMKTENGDDRYLVSVKEGEVFKKFFTASKEMKQILDKISDIEDGFPFETIIRSEVFGDNKIKYIFT
ncbi:MAG: RNA-directed DNA polymerase [Bacteroidaceae bacterium]|nr:RNA-directed DNA polymerase [Bacteroidaceae bacterium]